VSFALAATGTFVSMAAASAVSRLFIYFFTCAAALRLRAAGAAPFRAPLGPAIPLAAIAIVVAILVGATNEQKAGGLVTLAVGAVFFAAAVFGRGRAVRQS